VCFVNTEKFHRGCKYTPDLKDASLFQKKSNIPKRQVLGGFSFQRTISHEKKWELFLGQINQNVFYTWQDYQTFFFHTDP
jgi:hypothetical protein